MRGADAWAAARFRASGRTVAGFGHPSTPRCWQVGGFRGPSDRTIGVTGSGLLIWTGCARCSKAGRRAVSVMLANNETGAVQPVAEAAEIIHAAGGLLHVDAIQAFGKISFDIMA